MARQPSKPFTGKHMAAILVTGFGVVACVNFIMASYAIGGFHGTVVENSYVASQHFNEWLDEAEEARALGWTAGGSRDETGHVVLETMGLPRHAQVSAELRRPIGVHEYASLTFAPVGDGRFRSIETVDPGRWTMRLTIKADGHDWAEESEI